MLYAAAFILGLFGNRVRGGLYHIPGGDLPARFIGSVIGFGVIGFAAGLGWWSVALAFVALIGDTLAGAENTYGTPFTFLAFVRMWVYGIERIAVVGIGLALYARFTGGIPRMAFWLVPAMAVCPLVYALAPYWPLNIPWLGIKARTGADSGFGEAVWGGIVGVSLLVACHGI